MTVSCYVCVPASFGQELPEGLSGSITGAGDFSYGYYSRDPLSSVYGQNIHGLLKEYTTFAILSSGYEQKHLWVGNREGEWAQIDLFVPTIPIQQQHLWGERYLHGTDEIRRDVEVGRYLLKAAADRGMLLHKGVLPGPIATGLAVCKTLPKQNVCTGWRSLNETSKHA